MENLRNLQQGKPVDTQQPHAGGQCQPMKPDMTATGQQQKGMAEKIKEKIPGVGGDKTGAGAGAGAGKITTGTHQQHQQTEHEKKGMMEKIKEKLPGGGN